MHADGRLKVGLDRQDLRTGSDLRLVRRYINGVATLQRKRLHPEIQLFDQFADLLKIGLRDVVAVDAQPPGDQIGPPGWEVICRVQQLQPCHQLVKGVLDYSTLLPHLIDTQEELRLLTGRAAHKAGDVNPPQVLDDPVSYLNHILS